METIQLGSCKHKYIPEIRLMQSSVTEKTCIKEKVD